MNKRKKAKIILACLFLLTLWLCPTVCGATVEPTNQFFVNDYADVLSVQTEQQIQSTAVALYNETTAQVCVLTIDSLDGEDISEYSVEVFRDWNIGDTQKDNGVLILLSIDDRELWVTTGYGVEGTLTDTRLGQFRDTYAFPYYHEDNFDEGTLQLFNAIVNELRVEEYGLSGLENFNTMQPDYYNSTIVELPPEFISTVLFLLLIPFLLVITVIPALITRYFYLRRYDRLHGTNRLATFMVKMNKIKEIILFIVLFTRRSSRGHYHRGGSTGGFHGGGFGGFRGGGGSTGGGGAGGRF